MHREHQCLIYSDVLSITSKLASANADTFFFSTAIEQCSIRKLKNKCSIFILFCVCDI